MRRTMCLATLAITALSHANLGPSFMLSGHVGAELAASANSNFNGNMSLTLANVPIPGFVHKAYLYANDWNSTANMSGTFAGVPLVSSPPITTDNNLSAYRWDVTGIVQTSGNGNYAVSLPGVNQLFGSALAVVFDSPGLPLGQVELHDGANALGDAGMYETGQTFFQNFGPGSGTLSIYTEGDDNSASGETVDFNGTIIHTGLDGNLGPTASMHKLGVNVLSGTNTLTLATTVPSPNNPMDVFGWHVAMLVGPQAVPEPATVAVLGLGIAFLARRKRQ